MVQVTLWSTLVSSPNPNVLDATSKDIQAVKLVSNKIFYFLLTGSAIKQDNTDCPV